MPDSAEIADYCRQIETYLCQKNAGHLIRVVGPSFELVARWAADGVPLKVAYRGIDRTAERASRKGPRRRPLKIDFCDADVMDVFDEWRRATGLTAMEARGDDAERPVKRGPSLVDHLQRVLLRLTNARATGTIDDRVDALIDAVSRELDAARANPRGLRGEERQALITRLSDVDRDLMSLARTAIAPGVFAEIERDVASELAAFQANMAQDALQRARIASVDQAVRDRLRLPTIAFPHV